MPHLDGIGPDAKGLGTGRRLGNCFNVSKEELLSKLGKGQGERRCSGGGIGDKKRLKSSNKFNK